VGGREYLMAELAVFKNDFVNRKIHNIRDAQIILDRDLAELYGVKAIRLREQVKRNMKRFPSDFMFQLNEQEVDFLVSQNAIPSKKHLGGFLPYAFTEQGVANLSSVLSSDKAIEVNIQIMRAFVAMRKFVLSNAQLFQRLDKVEKKQFEHETKTDKNFEKIFKTLEHKQITPRQGIFFEGQIFDAYQFISDLIRSAKKSITIIDNYIDDTVLTHMAKRNKNVKATILTKLITKSLALDLKKHSEQYAPIEIIEFKNAHDRFLIIDDATIYHFGASLKDLGKKWCAFSRFDKESFELMQRVDTVLRQVHPVTDRINPQ
jgi:hypothetical protein